MNSKTKTLILITLGITAMCFGHTPKELKHTDNELYPNKKPLIDKTPIQNANKPKHLKVRKHINNAKVKKVLSSVDRPERLRKRGR